MVGQNYYLIFLLTVCKFEASAKTIEKFKGPVQTLAKYLSTEFPNFHKVRDFTQILTNVGPIFTVVH